MERGERSAISSRGGHCRRAARQGCGVSSCERPFIVDVRAEDPGRTATLMHPAICMIWWAVAMWFKRGSPQRTACRADRRGDQRRRPGAGRRHRQRQCICQQPGFDDAAECRARRAGGRCCRQLAPPGGGLGQVGVGVPTESSCRGYSGRSRGLSDPALTQCNSKSFNELPTHKGRYSSYNCGGTMPGCSSPARSDRASRGRLREAWTACCG
jgi:hypothetical protein